MLVERKDVQLAESLVQSFEHCTPGLAEIPFDIILVSVTGGDPAITEYVLEMPAKCPLCQHEIFEKTLVVPAV